ncbi:MAG: hypothetical protein AB7K68_17225 [Bacteriovoracia bacterium]
MEQLPKIAITLAADQSVDSLYRKVNDGIPGRITKGQIASWLLINSCVSMTPKQIEKIRGDHFDEIAHLESVVRQLKEAKKTNAPLIVQDLLTPVLQRQRSAPSGPVLRTKDKE